jgi:uncharacterized phiE125 gp8 family phage protein
MPIILEPISEVRVVTWAEAKKHLRLDSDDEKSYVESLIDAATEYAEERLSTTLLERSRTQIFYDAEPLIPLPRGPLVSITSVTDADDNEITNYELSRVGHSDRMTITGSFKAPLTIVYRAGYASAAAIPASIRLAILQHVATLFENRESVSDKTKLPVPHSLEDFYKLKSRGSKVA